MIRSIGISFILTIHLIMFITYHLLYGVHDALVRRDEF